MKANRFLLFVVAAAVLFAACGKDEVDLEDNQLYYDGMVYNMVSSAESNAEGNYVSFWSEGKEVLFELSGTFDQASLNRTYNLTTAAEDVHYNIDFNSEALALFFSFDMNHGEFYGGLAGSAFEGGSIFSNGTCTISYDNNDFEVTLDGTLKNGKRIAFKVDVPKARMMIQE